MKFYSKILTIILLIAIAAFTVYNVEAQDKIYKNGERGPAGGWIFYDKGSYSGGWRYLEAAPEDQTTGDLEDLNTGAKWGCYGKSISGAQSTAIGTGKSNTLAIVNGCAEAGIAAKLCAAYRGGGKSDWFLPSKNELNLMYTNLKKIGVGGFTNFYYPSSSENSAYFAWGQFFVNGYQDYNPKDGPYLVRAVRAF